MNNTLLPGLAILGGLVVAQILLQTLKRIAQPVRLDLAEKGEAMMGDASVPASMRASIQMMLDTAFGMRLILLAGIVAAPFMLPFIVTDPTDEARDGATREQIARYDEIDELHSRVMFANNPILLTILFAEVLVLGVPMFLIATFLSGKLLAVPKAEGVLTRVAEPVLHHRNGFALRPA